jgi:hypothetical protein
VRERGVDKVVIIADAADARIGIIAGEDWIPVVSFGKRLLEDRIAAGVFEGREAHGLGGESCGSESESENESGE